MLSSVTYGRYTIFLQVQVAELRIVVGGAVERQSLRSAIVCHRLGAAISPSGQEPSLELRSETPSNRTLERVSVAREPTGSSYARLTPSPL